MTLIPVPTNPDPPFHFLVHPNIGFFRNIGIEYNQRQREFNRNHGGEVQFAMRDKAHIHQNVRWGFTHLVEYIFSPMTDTIECQRRNGKSFTTVFHEFGTEVSYAKINPITGQGYTPPFLDQQRALFDLKEIPQKHPYPILCGWHLNTDLTIEALYFVDKSTKARFIVDLQALTYQMPMPDAKTAKGAGKLIWNKPDTDPSKKGAG